MQNVLCRFRCETSPRTPRSREPDERVEVRPVDVHLTTRLVYEVADLADVLLEDAVRRRVGDHDRRDTRAVVGQLRAQVGQVHLAALRGPHDLDLQPRQRRRRRVRAVRRRGDQAHVTLHVAARHVVLADRQEARELALRPRVRLHRDARVTRDLRERRLEAADELLVAARLVGRHERVQVREPRPGDGLHLRRRVELHRARAQRDHRAVQREVLVRETAQVAQHRRLGAVQAEDRVLEVRRRPGRPGREVVAGPGHGAPSALGPPAASTPNDRSTVSTVAGWWSRRRRSVHDLHRGCTG